MEFLISLWYYISAIFKENGFCKGIFVTFVKKKPQVIFGLE